MPSFDAAVRDIIRDEVERAVAPMRELVERLSPLVRVMGGAVPGGARRERASVGARVRPSQARPCALIGCKRPARSKGYCAAHYQKYRNLARTNRLPADWKPNAPPGSVADIVLPRGRAAAKLLKEAKKK